MDRKDESWHARVHAWEGWHSLVIAGASQQHHADHGWNMTGNTAFKAWYGQVARCKDLQVRLSACMCMVKSDARHQELPCSAKGGPREVCSSNAPVDGTS